MSLYIPEIKFSVQIAREHPLTKIYDSRKLHEVFMQIFDMDTFDIQESCYAVYINRNNEILGYKLISFGGMSATIIDPRIVFSNCFHFNAVGFAIAHNHPSGSFLLSEADKAITKKLKEGAEILNYTFVDHLVLTRNGYLSFNDEGYL